MRDIKRIKRICKLLEKYWSTVPDYRFGQMLINLGLVADTMTTWKMEDNDLAVGLNNFIKQNEKRS